MIVNDKKFTGNYRGLVVETRDPRDIGRIKVLVYGVYPHDIPHDHLPWAIPALGMYQSGGDNLHSLHNYENREDSMEKGFNQTGTGGEFTVPFEGNHVWVFFDQGNHMNPVYFAMAPGENDWLRQKKYIKDKLGDKLDQIKEFRDIFQQEDGTAGFHGVDWADGAFNNTRQNISSFGEKGPTTKNDNGDGEINYATNGGDQDNEIIGGNYAPILLNINHADSHTKSSKNMTEPKHRAWQNYIGLDIKPLFDKENNETLVENIQRKGDSPHAYDKDWKYDDIDDDYERNVNRYITSKTTANGLTEIFDNRRGQENYYKIHQNYLENIDQHGSRKIFIGQNTTQKLLVDGDEPTGKGPVQDIRCNDELGVAGDKKTHIQGNRVDYIKGNHFTQVDKNTQIDTNDSYGIRVKKGDFDIIIEGDNNIGNDRNNGKDDREGPKTKQYGDLNIVVRNGKLELFVKETANLHIVGDVNLMVDGNMRTYVKKDYHLHVEGDYNEIIEGNKYETVEQNCEFRYNKVNKGHVKWEIDGDEFKDVHKNKHLRVDAQRFSNIQSNDNLTTPHLKVEGRADFTQIVRGADFHTPQKGLNAHIHPYTVHSGITKKGVDGINAPTGNLNAFTGKNVGGGAITEQEEKPIHKTKPTHNGDRTQKAKRDHNERTEKT